MDGRGRRSGLSITDRCQDVGLGLPPTRGKRKIFINIFIFIGGIDYDEGK